MNNLLYSQSWDPSSTYEMNKCYAQLKNEKMKVKRFKMKN